MDNLNYEYFHHLATSSDITFKEIGLPNELIIKFKILTEMPNYGEELSAVKNDYPSVVSTSGVTTETGEDEDPGIYENPVNDDETYEPVTGEEEKDPGIGDVEKFPTSEENKNQT